MSQLECQSGLRVDEQDLQARVRFDLKEVRKTKMLPGVAAQALELANDPSCSVSQFAELVERDSNLATDILRLSNSVIYSPAKPIAALDRAVVHLGFVECRNLIIAASMSSLAQRLSLSQEWIRESLWRHFFATGLTCRHLNKGLRLKFNGEEFAAGLIHDMGRMLIAVADPNLFELADPLEFSDESNVLEHERTVLGTDHCELGGWFAEMNGLPAALVDSIYNHHNPGDSSHSRLVSLVSISDEIANHLQMSSDPEGFGVKRMDAVQILGDGYGGFEEHLLAIVPKIIAQVRDELDSTL